MNIFWNILGYDTDPNNFGKHRFTNPIPISNKKVEIEPDDWTLVETSEKDDYCDSHGGFYPIEMNKPLIQKLEMKYILLTNCGINYLLSTGWSFGMKQLYTINSAISSSPYSRLDYNTILRNPKYPNPVYTNIILDDAYQIAYPRECIYEILSIPGIRINKYITISFSGLNRLLSNGYALLPVDPIELPEVKFEDVTIVKNMYQELDMVNCKFLQFTLIDKTIIVPMSYIDTF